MREFLISVLGEYVPVTYEQISYVSILDPDTEIEEVHRIVTEVVPAGLAGVDWQFVFTGILLCIVIYCVLKALGACVCRIS